ncbi:MAG TPA: enoyl-CoA hydratase-related protein [Caldilineaceae bacterium]|nr:enoyl-CoA hydratase-related protein [Caldilineaceae bacterium]
MQPIQSTVLLTPGGELLLLTLNRPAVLNAIDLRMAEELYAALDVAAHDEKVRALIITGSGRGFCAGGDLRFALEANPDQPGDSFLTLTATLHRCIELLRTMPKPVIAAINGVAAGAGLFLALACDLRIMASEAYLKQSNTSYGLSLPAGGSFFLPPPLGVWRALEMGMLGAPIPGERARELGPTTQIALSTDLLDSAQRLAAQVAQMPVGTLGRVKQLMNQAFSASLAEQLANERVALAASANSAEGREGLAAFVAKRPPVFVAG